MYLPLLQSESLVEVTENPKPRMEVAVITNISYQKTGYYDLEHPAWCLQ